VQNKVADLVLIQPLFQKDDRRRPPLHLMTMGTKTNEIVPTKIIDGQSLGLSTEELADLAVSFKPKIVGISILSPTFPVAVKLSKAIKTRLPNTLIIAGGKHTILETKKVLETGVFDLIIRGEGDYVLPDIIQKYLSAKKNTKSLQDLLTGQPGITFPNDKYTPTITTQVDLESLPPINWEILFPRLDYYLGNTVSVEDQRGCLYDCSYCSASKYYNKVTFRSLKQITNDVIYLNNQGFTSFFFTGDDSFIDPQRIMEILKHIATKKLSVNLIMNTHADSFMRCIKKYSSEFTTALTQAHVTTLHMGVESGDEKILKLCNKKIDLKNVYETIAIANKLSIIVETNWIVGLPDDSEESINNSITRLVQYKSSSFFSWSVKSINL